MKENIHQELIKLQDELTKLKNAVDHIDQAKEASRTSTHAAENVVSMTTKISKDYEDLAIKSEELVQEIDSIDFPVRLDKIDASIAGINAGVQNINSRVDSLERNLSDRINSAVKELDVRLKMINENQVKNFKLTKILLFIIIAIALGFYSVIILIF